MSLDALDALNAITVFIKSFLPQADIKRVSKEDLMVTDGGKSIRLPFNRGNLQDFSLVLKGNQPGPYARGLQADLHASIYATLGMVGMIPHVRISEVLLHEEDRNWLSGNVRTEVQFTESEAKELYQSLQELQSSLRETLKEDIELPAIEKELTTVSSLIQAYQSKGHLNEQDASSESLACIKGAAMCWLLRLESAKAKQASTRVKEALDKKIYWLVQRYWLPQPYNGIKLPVAIHDLIAQRRQQPALLTQHAYAPRIDVSGPLKKFDSRLEERRQGAWQALNSDNLDRVSQAANSMVELLDKVIDRVRGDKEFKDYLADRFPQQADVVIATRTWISKIKTSLHGVKHNTNKQSEESAQDLMHQAEWIVSLLLRP